MLTSFDERYPRRPILPHHSSASRPYPNIGTKSSFDVLVVAVSLALGLNSAASLRHIAMRAMRRFERGQTKRVTWRWRHVEKAVLIGVD